MGQLLKVQGICCRGQEQDGKMMSEVNVMLREGPVVIATLVTQISALIEVFQIQPPLPKIFCGLPLVSLAGVTRSPGSTSTTVTAVKHHFY